MAGDGTCELLPRDAEPCVWMRAGLIRYKLCDRDFDCERCPLDAALRGDTTAAPSVAELAEAPVPTSAAFPEDRYYHPCHAWVERLDEDRCRFGVDTVAARLLAPVRKIVLPPPRSRLTLGRAAWWVRDDDAMLPLPAPVSGTVLRVNSLLMDEPSLLAASPYAAGWLVEARCRGELEAQPDLFDAGEQTRHTAAQLSRIGRQVARIVGSAADVGPTLADGGQHLTDLRAILGAERYRRLVLSILY